MKIPNGVHITWRQEFVKCGRKTCRVCAASFAGGHGPYWYAYATVKGRFGKCYVGKDRAAWESARAAGAQAPQRKRSKSNTQAAAAKGAPSPSNTQAAAKRGARSPSNTQAPEGTADQRAMLLRGVTPKLAARVLGVAPGASPAQIKSAFRGAMQVAHPDKGGNNTAAAAVSAAYALLRKMLNIP